VEKFVLKVEADQEKLALNAYNVGAEYGVMLPFSRFHETEADEMGIHLMAKAAGAVYEAACDAVQRRPAGPPRRRTAAKKRPGQGQPGGR